MELAPVEEFLYVPSSDELSHAVQSADQSAAQPDFTEPSGIQDVRQDPPNPSPVQAHANDAETNSKASEFNSAEAKEGDDEEEDREDDEDDEGDDDDQEEEEEQKDDPTLRRRYLGYPDLPFAPDDVTIVDLIRGHVSVNCRGHEVQIPVLMSLMLMSIIGLSPATFFVSIGFGLPLAWLVHGGLNWITKGL